MGNTPNRRSVSVFGREGTIPKVTIILDGEEDAGKTTFFQQLQTISSEVIPRKELSLCGMKIQAYLIYCICITSRFCLEEKVFQDDTLNSLCTLFNGFYDGEAFNYIEMFKHYTVENQKLVQQLWANEKFRDTFRICKFRFQFFENVEFFLEPTKFATLERGTWIPSPADMKKYHKKTLKSTQLEIMLKGSLFTFIDSSKEHGEVKDVTHILWFVSLVDYSVTCSDDFQKNRMEHTLSEFKKYLKGRKEGVPLWVVFTKRDVLGERLKTCPLEKLYPDYTGGTVVDSAADFIKEQYHQVVEKGKCEKVSFTECYPLDLQDCHRVLEDVIGSKIDIQGVIDQLGIDEVKSPKPVPREKKPEDTRVGEVVDERSPLKRDLMMELYTDDSNNK